MNVFHNFPRAAKPVSLRVPSRDVHSGFFNWSPAICATPVRSRQLIMASWEHELREMFSHHDKDMSGFISKDDVLCMLLGAEKDDRKDPLFKTNLKFLINVIKEADKDGDMKISFEEFKEYITKATAQ